MILLLQNSIQNYFTTKRHLTIFFAFNKEFDMSWRFKILKKLHKFGFRGQLPNYIQNFLLSRYFNIRLGDQLLKIYELINGVPQGSVLSPTLFNVTINNRTENVSRPVKCALFRDDITMFILCVNVLQGHQFCKKQRII